MTFFDPRCVEGPGITNTIPQSFCDFCTLWREIYTGIHWLRCNFQHVYNTTLSECILTRLLSTPGLYRWSVAQRPFSIVTRGAPPHPSNQGCAFYANSCKLHVSLSGSGDCHPAHLPFASLHYMYVEWSKELQLEWRFQWRLAIGRWSLTKPYYSRCPFSNGVRRPRQIRGPKIRANVPPKGPCWRHRVRHLGAIVVAWAARWRLGVGRI